MSASGVPLGRKATGADPLRIGILVSGRGSNMESIIRTGRDEGLPYSVEIVLSDRPDAGGLAKAAALDIPAVAYDYAAFADKPAYHAKIVERLMAAKVEVVALAGYMRLLPAGVLEAFPNRIVNIHPSLLPSFPGLHPHRQALEYGVKVSGCTVHLVDAGVDSGPILLQETVPVGEGETEESLAARILKVEHTLYPRALALLASGEWLLSGRTVFRHRSEVENDGRKGSGR